MQFPIDIQIGTKVQVIVKNDSKETDVRSFVACPGVALPDTIFNLENRGKHHPDERGQHHPIVHGLKPGWTLLEMQDLAQAPRVSQSPQSPQSLKQVLKNGPICLADHRKK